MKTARVEAFSDAVLAIIITILVLEMKVPHGTDWSALGPLVPVFATYVMSFVYLGIYWNNHHHMLHLTDSINGLVLWANLHLLFWLSLIPFVTGWMGENHFAALPTALYGGVLLLASLAWMLLQMALVADRAANARLREALGRDPKGKTSVALYAVAIFLAFFVPWVAIGIYVLVACIWLIPDRRFEGKLKES
jgi:TMEM175 potassium channel family protein